MENARESPGRQSIFQLPHVGEERCICHKMLDITAISNCIGSTDFNAAIKCSPNLPEVRIESVQVQSPQERHDLPA